MTKINLMKGLALAKSIKSTIGILSLASGLAATASAQSSLTNGLVAYYPFNGDATDASGNGNDGTTNGIAWVSDRFGNANAACQFYGNGGSYVDIPPSMSLSFPDEITVSAWCAIEGPGTYDPRLISIDNLGSPSSSSYQLAFRPGTSTLVFLVNTGGSGFSAEWTGSITNGQWIHLAGVATRTAANLYVNGVLAASQPGPAISQSPQPTLFNIGRLTVPLYDAFNGRMDDVRIYNRALSDSEIQQLYVYAGPAPRPSLHISPAGHFALVWWPTNASGFVLETSTRLGVSQNWSALSGPINVVGDQNLIVTDAVSGSKFFRLRGR